MSSLKQAVSLYCFHIDNLSNEACLKLIHVSYNFITLRELCLGSFLHGSFCKYNGINLLSYQCGIAEPTDDIALLLQVQDGIESNVPSDRERSVELVRSTHVCKLLLKCLNRRINKIKYENRFP